MSCSLVKQRICHLMLFALLALVMVLGMTTVASAASVNPSTATGAASAASAGIAQSTTAPAYGGHGYTPISYHRGPGGYYQTRYRGRRWGCISRRWSNRYRRTICYRSGWIYY